MSTRPAVPLGRSIATTMSVHVYPGAPMGVRLHPQEDRVVVVILGEAAGCPTTLDLFCQRAELVALRDILTTAVADLDTAQRTPIESAGLDEADSPAA